jgi:NAD(P)-dependent dehydrogenase (short-subunit alcohol dehydrogenase family)
VDKIVAMVGGTGAEGSGLAARFAKAGAQVRIRCGCVLEAWGKSRPMQDRNVRTAMAFSAVAVLSSHRKAPTDVYFSLLSGPLRCFGGPSAKHLV